MICSATAPTRLEPRAEAPAFVRALRSQSILVWMLAAIALVTGLAWWDADRESRAGLDDFGHEQTTLAGSLVATLLQRLGSADPAAIARTPPAQTLAAVDEIERPGLVRILLATPSGGALIASDGTRVSSDALESAIARGDEGSLRLGRDDAARLGLPARTAMAGLRTLSDAAGGRWTVAVVATAQTERDRERRAQIRLVSSVLLASLLVVAFGGYALRRQREELELRHRLAVAEIVRTRDERLVRADKLATMGALATGIAHEVSTPLGVIVARAEQLLPKQGDDRGRRAVEAIVAQTERIFAVIRGFLTLARGGQPMLARHDPAELARAAMALVEHRFEKAGVDLTSEIADDLPRVACDARLFEQVVVNLLLNACDACDEGGCVSLNVRSDGRRVAFVVVDDGKGISDEVAERATEPFFTTKREGEGTGLGLAIANEIVKHHMGTLTLSARDDGAGTRACVDLPAVRDDA